MTTALDLDGIETRAEAATDGPWQYDGVPSREDAEYGHVVTGGGIPGSPSEHQICWVGEFLNLRAPEDAAFIAHARTDVPALLAEVERLREATAAARASLQVLRWMIEEGGHNSIELREGCLATDAILRAALTPDTPDGAA